MKILFYNWVQFDDPKGRGGGITVYLADLMKQLSTMQDLKCTFLSSGVKYTFDGRLRIEQTDNQLRQLVKSFQIVNSPIHAPASIQFARLNSYLTDTSLFELLDSFIVEQGGFDIIHFHSLEGLSVSVLKLKEKYPETKFIYSIHNYHAFCPQVNLWSPQGNCYRNSVFPNCSGCVAGCGTKTEQFIGGLKSALKPFTDRTVRYNAYLNKMANVLRSVSMKYAAASRCSSRDMENGAIYQAYRSTNVCSINRYIDVVLAVSIKVSEVAKSYGIDPTKVVVSYIGTSAASHSKPQKVKKVGNLHIGYLGYAREDKGFHFLLRTLEAIPPEVAGKIELLLAAKCADQNQVRRYERIAEELKRKFHSVIYCDGFKKENQSELLDHIDLGIVPSLWEDNLPQVAIEYISSGIPILTSDAGGASELCANQEFVYHATNSTELQDKITHYADKPERVNSFWNLSIKLTTMENHVKNLLKLYK